ncbi:uncharacterized protein LOC126055534 isoform X1 [Helicoverpa armigera]|uniref:uncharacterized protein LOC126055534 isoform X1 n=2 Tax=Helicoverpa armigera TaxID=29058 RepID=UPI0030831372
MYYKCCMCNATRQDAILYHFPSNEKRLQMWLKCLPSARDDLKALTQKQLSKLFVCSKHFEVRFVTQKSRLVGSAYPTLFSAEEISRGTPSQNENVDPQTDHTYCRKRHFDHTYAKQKPLAELPLNTGGMQPVDVPGTSHISVACEDFPSTTGTTTFSGSLNTVVLKTKARARKRIINKIKDLTPTGKVIYKEYQKAKDEANFLKRARRALKFSKDKSFEELTKEMNPFAKTIMKMQINLCSKSKKGRRFTEEEKLIALSIMKQSPKCYRFLHKIFVLPSRSTLNKMVAKLSIGPGICQQVFDLLKKEVATWDEKKKICSVIFDEMSLDTALTYDKNRDCINGFVELNEKQNQFADHALVFMLRGAVYKWQQPIAFYYCQGATSGTELKKILRDVVAVLVECGLKPICVICDQGTSFQAALKSFREDTKRDQILADQEPDGSVTISGVNLSIIYDPSHLIKGIRNNFLNKNIVMDGKISKWTDIVDVYETDCKHTESRLLHKLNDQHVIPEKIKKMKVKNCVKVLSSTVSAALSYTAQFSHYADGRPVSGTIKNTAETVLFFDRLFDSINGAGSAKEARGKLRTAVTKKSPHHKFWTEAIRKLENLKFIDSAGKEKSVPSVKNFVITLKSYMRLWQILHEQHIKVMRPRYFNSDPIENFFGQVRAYNYRNNDPNCHSFNCTFKSLLITRFIKFHSENFNCEDDPADQVLNLQVLFDEKKSNESRPGNSPSEKNIEVIVEQARRERMNIHSRAYTAGWVVKKIFSKLKISCKNCNNSMTSERGDIHDWISHREYNKARKVLKYPSEAAVRCFGTVVRETNEYLEINAHNNQVAKKISDHIFAKYSFDFIDCTEHKSVLLTHFIVLTVRFTIMNWCNILNKILKGTDVSRLQEKDLPAMQKKAFEKFKKKLKNKSFNK